MSDHAAWEELAAGYAVNALEPEDEHAFAEHLRGCDVCKATLAEMQQVAGDLAYAAEPDEPPPDLRRRILDAAAAERRPRAPGSVPVVTSPAQQRADRTWWPRLPAVAGVAAGLVILALAGWNVTLRGDNDARQAALDRRTAALRCLAAADTPKFDLSGNTGQHAKTCLAGGSAYVVADNIDPNDTARNVYVLWWMDAGSVPHAVERFDVESDGTAVFELPLNVTPTDVHAMAISLEPGRALPATPTRPIAAGDATSA